MKEIKIGSGLKAIIAVGLVSHFGVALAVFSSANMPDMRAYLIIAGILCLVLVPLTIWRFRVAKLVVSLLILTSLYFVWTDPMNPRRAFLEDLHSIRSEMTVREVEKVMSQHEKLNDHIQDGQRIIEYSHKDLGDGWRKEHYSSDIGKVVLIKNKVVHTEYLPD